MPPCGDRQHLNTPLLSRNKNRYGTFAKSFLNKLSTTKNTLRKRLSELAARKYIYPIRQGLYRVNSNQCQGGEDLCSPFAIGARAAPFCYLGFKTALQFHAQEIPKKNDIIYVVSPTKFNSFCFEDRIYFWSQSVSEVGLENHTIEHQGILHNIICTSIEKTIVDCLKRPTHCPPWHEFLTLCKKIPQIPKIQQLIEYATQCKIQILLNRLGFLLEIQKEQWNIPNHIIEELTKKISNKGTEWHTSFDKNKRKELEETFETSKKWKIEFSRFS